MMELLRVENLTKRYAGFTLDNVSFAVPGGTIVGLVGENGAGKSTTLRMILDLVHRDAGQVTVLGQSLPLSKMLHEDIGVVFDELSYHEMLTASQLNRIMAGVYRQWDAALYTQYMGRFSLPQQKPLKTFSRGMKMKLSLAVALSHHPKLLILDEPTGGLDPIIREDLMDVFLSFVQDDEHAILLSSHITSDLERVADYIVCIHDGRVLFSQSKDTLRYRWGVLRCSHEQFHMIDPSDIVAYRREEYQVSVLVEDKNAVTNRYPDMVVDNATIDEILLLYVKGERIA